MKECKNPVCDSPHLVYSGIDALLLRVETETWCYTCANVIAVATRELEEAK